jgi:hypothetical protein
VTKNGYYSRMYLLGTLAGFIICTTLGAALTTVRLPIADFKRFFEYINPNGGFYLTYNEILAQAREKLAQSKGRTLVIIGGDSVFFGEGQSTGSLWTEELAKQLGDQYAVINLALPGTKVFEAGYWVYEKLKAEGEPVILVTTAMPSTVFEPSGTIPVHYMYFDAVERKCLGDYDERDLFSLRHSEWTLFKDGEHRDTLKLRSIFNHYLSCEELWTRFTYSIMGNYYHRNTAYRSLEPRSWFKDPLVDRPAFDPIDTEKLDQGTNIIRHYMAGITSLYEPQIKEETQQFFWRRLAGCTKASVPDNCKSQIMVCVTALNPLFLDELTASERAKYDRIKSLWLKNFREHGFYTVELNNELKPDCYIDFDHLTPSGGKAMASTLAPLIKQFTQSQKSKPEAK